VSTHNASHCHQLRALEKKARDILSLKSQLARGIELDTQQQSKLRTEKKLAKEIEEIRLQVAAEEEEDAGKESEEEEEEEPVVVVANGRATLQGAGKVAATTTAAAVRTPSRVVREKEPEIDTSGMGKLELARHQKKTKQKERLLAKQEKKDDKEDKESGKKRARIELSKVSPAAAAAAKKQARLARPPRED